MRPPPRHAFLPAPVLPVIAVLLLTAVTLVGCGDVATDRPEPMASAPTPQDVVARIHGKDVLRSEIDPAEPVLYRHGPGEKLMGQVFGTLYAELIAEHELEATEAEIDAYLEAIHDSREEQHQVPPSPGAREPADADRRFGAFAVTQWNADHLLFERYGGRVCFQQLNPMEPTGAYLAFLEDHQQQGTFEILDPTLVPDFWAYLERKGKSRDAEDVNFSQPWWQQRPSR